MLARTSRTHPLEIATVAVPGGAGRIGITLCPGKKDGHAQTGAWNRDVATDVAAISDWGAVAVVCTMEPHELDLLQVGDLPRAVAAAGLAWLHLPIEDVNVPAGAFERGWATAGPVLHRLLDEGRAVLVHCRGGLGRSGTVAARLLVERGVPAGDAIAAVRAVRPGAIETRAQEEHVAGCRPPCPAPALDPARLDRAVGCLLGLAVGDAVGTTLEFKRRDSYPHLTDMVGGGPFRLRPGEWTDDTSMALCLADSLLATGRLDQRDLMERFRRWWRDGVNSVTGRCFDIGSTTSAAIARFEQSGEPVAGDTHPRSAGNGCIMRLAPVALAYWNQPAQAEAAARAQCVTTHGAAAAIDGAALLCRMLLAAMAGESKPGALLQPADAAWQPKIRDIATGEWQAKRREQIRSSGYVVDTLEAAAWAVAQTDSFGDAVLLAANLGDDADTVAAVTGQIAGALYGASSIPSDWLERLAWREHIELLATRLIHLPAASFTETRVAAGGFSPQPVVA